MVVKVYLTLNLDKDDYPVPADGDPSEEIQQALEEFIYDIDCLLYTSTRPRDGLLSRMQSSA